MLYEYISKYAESEMNIINSTCFSSLISPFFSVLKYATAGFMDWVGGGETGTPGVAIVTPQLRLYSAPRIFIFMND